MELIKYSDANKSSKVIASFTKDQLHAYNHLIEFINKGFDANDYKRALIGSAGTGKATTEDTPILTPNGWKRMGDIEVGDIICSPFNGTSKVTGVFPQGEREVYTIIFDGCRTIEVDGEHLWLVRTEKLKLKYHYNKNNDNTAYSKILTTKELIAGMSLGIKYYVPLANAFEGINKELPINPYVLGILIGDGVCSAKNISTRNVIFISNDEEDIISNVANLINADSYKLHNSNNYTNTIYGECCNFINNKLVEYGLNVCSYDKFIPKEYLFASMEQRKELLKGLFDSDGYIDNKGRYRFTTTSNKLKDDFIELCRGLGYNVGVTVDKRNKYTNGKCYDISIQTSDVIFNSNKHLKKYSSLKKPVYYNDHICIKSIIKQSSKKLCKCISVSDKDKLYIAKDFIVTHNTYMIKEVISKCNLANSTIGLAAPTHKAARVLRNSTGFKTSTIASDLGFRLNTDLADFDIKNPPFDPLAEKKIKGYRLYIIDEASMINRSLKTYIEKECANNECMIIYMGDSYQLPPVKESRSCCFDSIKSYELKQIVRQEEDNPVSHLLKLLRYDIQHRSWTFLEYINRNRFAFDISQSKGYYTCNRQEFESLVIDGFYCEEFTKDIDTARLVCYTNKAVSTWNSFIRNNIIEDCNKAVLTKNDLLLSYITLVDDFNDAIITNSEDYIIKDITNFTNKDGIKGFMVKFISVNGGESTKPLFVVDHSDYSNVAVYYKLCNNLIDNAKAATNTSSRRQRWKEYYEFKERNLLLVNLLNKQGKIEFSRDLDYGFALTANKSQGSTFKDVYVDVNDIVFMSNGTPYSNIDETLRRLYTACSRCKNRLFLCYGW